MTNLDEHRKFLILVTTENNDFIVKTGLHSSLNGNKGKWQGKKVGKNIKNFSLIKMYKKLQLFVEDTVCDQNACNFDTKSVNECSFRKYCSHYFALNHL